MYRYFTGKDQIISAAVAGATADLAQALAPILTNPDPPALPEFVNQLMSRGFAYGLRDSEIDRLRVAIHGWSYSQTDPQLKAATMAAYRGMRNQCAATVKKWQAAGTVDPQAAPAAIAQLIMSICLGFVA